MDRPTFDASIGMGLVLKSNKKLRKSQKSLRASIDFVAGMVEGLHPHMRSTFDNTGLTDAQILDNLQQSLDETVRLSEDLQAFLQLLERNVER